MTVRGNFDWLFTRWSDPTWHPKTYKDELLLRDFEFTVARLSEADQVWLGNLPMAFTASIEGVQMELYHP